MNAFETLVAEILESEGYWVRTSFKVGLTKEDKVRMGRPSSPRWEIDVLAYRAPENLVLAVECKSYLDSPGVSLGSIQGGRGAKRYKLFAEPMTREVVLGRLASDLVEQGLCSPDPKIQLALAAGRVKSDPEKLRQYIAEMGWFLFDPAWIRQRLHDTASKSYSDSVAPMVAKLLLRDGSS